MRKRILSLVLAIAMCFSMVSAVTASDDMELLETTLTDLMNNYRDRVWEWQTNQFDAMTDEQTAVIDAAWTNYEANRDGVKAKAEELASEIITDKMLSNETMKDLYKWKLMRDIMEGRLEITNEDADYVDWLSRFTAFEEANDEAISASAPVAALNGLKVYSAELTEYFGELAGLVDNGLEFEGEGAAKATAYVAAFDLNGDGEDEDDDMASIMDYLRADVKELMSEGMFNAFDLGMQIATNQVNQYNTTGFFDEVPDRDLKAAFLIVGEDFTRYLINQVTVLRSDLLAMDKGELIESVLSYTENGIGVTDLLSPNSVVATEAMYITMRAVAYYVLDQGFMDEFVGRVYTDFEIDLRAENENVVDTTVTKLDEAMKIVDENHGLELVHYNTYVGRAMLRYNDNGDLVLLAGAEIDGDEVSELALGFAHNRYPAFEEKLNGIDLAQYDVEGNENGITVVAGDNIGQLIIEVSEDADGEAVVKVYRGYSDENMDGEDEHAEDVYRYVTAFTVSAGEDATADITEVTTPSEDDPTITVKGETNLDEVDVVVKDEEGNVIYDETHTKEELEAGIDVVLPGGVTAGDKFTVEVTEPGKDDVLDSEEVTVADAYYVELDDVANTTVDGTITVKGETNLAYVTVAIIKNGETIYAVVYSEAEFEAGIELNAPDNAQIGEVYTVVVGTEKASDSDEFAIEGADDEYYVELDDVADTTVDGTITVKGETNLEYVTVAIIKNGETIYAVVYSEAEFEAGIELNAPDNAQIGEVYTVVVGTEKAADSDEFAITGVYVNLEDVQDPTLDGEVVIKGETNLDEVDVVIKDEEGNVIYDETHTKEELEAGIEVVLPEGIEPGDKFTVEITQPGDDEVLAEDDFTVVDGPYVRLDDVLDTTVDGTITIKGTTNLEYVTVSIVKDGETIYAVVYEKAKFEEGITLNAPDGAVIGDVYTVAVGTEEASDDDTFTIIGEIVPEADITVDKTPTADDPTIDISGDTNLDEVEITVKDEEGNIVDVVIKDKDGNVLDPEHVSKEDLDAGIEIVLPEGVEPGDKFTVEVKDPATDEVLDSEDVTVAGVRGKLALAGSTTRTAKVNGTVTITTTPQDIYPEDATVTVVWTTEDGTIVEITSLAGDTNNIATITKLAKGTTTVTATLYVNGVAVDSKTITIKNKSNPGPSSSDKVYTSITVKVDETKDVTKAPSNGTSVEFIPGSGSGEVKVDIVDGVIVVTGVTVGTVRGQLVVRNEKGNIVSTSDYEFIVIDGDKPHVEHECEWPDIAAGWEGKADAHWAHLTIDVMTINGYIKGYPDGLFKPDQNITRAEFSAIVYRILGLVDTEDGVYYDDTTGHWAEELIATMSLPEGYGMLRGYGDGNFGPNDFITREQAVAIIARAKSAVWVAAEEGAKDVFTDSEDISWWFDGEMDAAVTNGLITGYEDGSYRPLGFTTRAEACTLLARAWPEVLELAE